jgi:hypothetical protein
MKLGDSAEAYLGLNRISHHVAIYYNPGSRAAVESEAQRAANARPDIFVGSLSGVSFRIVCERDKADANGQLALITAFKAGSTVVLEVYPEGKTVGNEKWTATCYVTGIGELTLKNGSIPGNEFKLVVSGTMTEGVVP